MATLRIEFDRGTLRLDPAGVGEASATFDARTGFYRASAHRYRELVDRARDTGRGIDDRVAPAALPAPIAAAASELRPYQQQALAAFERFGKRGIVVMPTGSGKTRVACAAIARAATSALVLVPTCALLQQWRAVLGETFQGTIGVIGDRQTVLAPITVMTFESAYRRLDDLGHRFGLLVVDEVHHFGGGLRAEALEMCVAPLRLGLTATPPDPGSAAAARLVDLVGPIVFEIEIADLVGEHLAAYDVLHLHVSLEADERVAYEADAAAFTALRREIVRAQPAASWLELIRAVARAPGGRDAISRMHRATALAAFPRAKRALARELLVRHRRDPCLVFTACADDAYRVGSDSLVPVITAETSRAERTAILAGFARGELRALASARVLNEGFDVPEASVAVIVGGALGRREHVQRIGRVLRPAPGKRALVYELVTGDTVDEARSRGRARRLAPR